MGNNTWDNALDPFPTAVGAAFGTFTTIQDVSPQPLPTLYGNELRLGSKLEMEAFGEYSCATGVTLALGFYYGTTAVVLGQTAAITTGTSPTAWAWHLHWLGVVVGVGTSGSIVGNGILDLGTSLTAISANALPTTQALRTVAIDTTIAKTLGVCATYGASAGGNTVRTNGLICKVSNQGKTS